MDESLIEKQNGNFANTVSADGFIDRIIDIPFKQYTGCYLLYSENELVYVGVACDVAVRLWQHRYKKGKHWDKVKYIEETDYLKAIQIENYFINTYKPKYNKAGSKLEWSKLSFKDKFDESKIPYPSGWNYPLTPKQQQHEQN